MPVKDLVKTVVMSPNLRTYAANMVYVGVVAQLLGIDMGKIRKAVDFHFKGKKTAADLNYNIILSAANWAAVNLEKQAPYRVEPMDKTDGLILAEGNTAAALGSLFGGVQFVSWYPITPATTLAEELNYYLPKLRKDPVSGKMTCVVVQAEDELAAIGMAIGAGWGGLRAMTSTSGPGVSLMAEMTGLAYFTETPLVIWDITRVGPITGMPTRTSQSDLAFIYNLGHGDIDNIILIPGDPYECFEYGWKALDFADRFQTPIFVVSDLDLGMQYWMTRPFAYPDKPMDRGKILWEKDLEERRGEWGLYLDEDDDGIPYRTEPGNHHVASPYMARGTSHNEYAKYTESAENWERVINRIQKKFETSRTILPEPVIENAPEQTVLAFITSGTVLPAVQEARDELREQHDTHLDVMRVRAIPFHPQVEEFIRSHERVYVVELNRDGQLRQLLTIQYPQFATRLVSLCHVDGLAMTARWIRTAFLEKEGKLV